jgi:hypothetical protein
MNLMSRNGQQYHVCHVGHMERIGIIPAIIRQAGAFEADTS